eukprot:1580670-Alexandrium_andersonii.AAC.1
MFTNPDKYRQDFPCLSSHAAEAAALIPVIARMCQEYGTGSRRDESRSVCAQSLVQMENILHRNGVFLDEEAHLAF